MSDGIGALERALGVEVVATGDEIPVRNWNDWAGLDPVRPLALVRPRSTEEVAAALRICSEWRLPVVPQGGLTGLAGGARPRADAVALSLERLAGVEDIDPASASMLVRAGTTLQAAQEAAAAADLFLPLDLGARGSCQIGGNLATNAGGNRVIRFGMAREMVLGLEAVTADGTVMSSLNRLIKNNAGFDLRQLFVGSEGTLGVVTRAVLRLQPQPVTRVAAFCGLRDYPAVVELLRRARRGLGGLLSAFEVMWPVFCETMFAECAHLRRPLSGRHGMYVLLEAQGYDPHRDGSRFEQLLEGMLVDGLLADAALAGSEAEIRRLWEIRDAVAEFRRIFGPHINFDIGLLPQHAGAYVDRLTPLLETQFPGIRAVYFGHLGDGNLHVVTSVPEGVSAHAIEALVYRLVSEFGGTISAEHGIGTIKKPWLALVRTPAEIHLMRQLKRTLDPHNILNPGKVIDP
ncbi:putative FAD-linked oxidoreductase [bacterium HR40]|nr:putative FAD-linked oxidoreductase [bacterium HR40]